MLGRSKSIKRDDAVIDSTPAEGNLVRVVKPKFISLVGSPANQVGFKVLRSDEGDSKMSNPGSQVIRRTRRADTSPVLRLTFPEGTNEANVSEALTNFGLSGYTVAQTEGVYTATRADLKSISKEKTMEIRLSDSGLLATVAAPDAGLENAPEKTQLAISSLEFSADIFNSDAVKAWLAENSVDGALQEQQNPDECYVVRRSDVVGDEETRRMQLDDGVTAVVVRSDVGGVPDGFIAIVSEAAYGGWGWGALDFNQMMANVAFSEQMETAIYKLRNILDNIILYSELPLNMRKELSNRALAQFGEYVSTVMDSLPRQLLVSVVRSANPEKEKSMTTNTNTPAATPETATPATVAAPVATEQSLTRSEIQEMIASGIAAGIKAATPVITRSDAEVAKENADKAAAEEAAKPLTRSDMQGMVDAILNPMKETIEQLKGVTVVRGSGESVPSKEVAKDVFRGAIPGLRSGQQK